MIQEQNRKLNTIIVVLTVLLTISLLALGGLLIYIHNLPLSHSSSSVGENFISPGEMTGYSDETGVAQYEVSTLSGQTLYALPTETMVFYSDPEMKSDPKVMELYKSQPQVNDPFAVANMFPGDNELKEYCVRVHHRGSVTVHFRANIRPDEAYEKLSEVLMVKVEVEGEELYDGLMRDMPLAIDYKTPTSSRKTTTDLDYKITAYLETSVGNEYKNKDLVADFLWWVDIYDDDGDDDDDDRPTKPETPEDPGEEPTEPDQPSEPPVEPEQPGELVDPPKTGDNGFVWIFLALASGLLLLFLIFSKRKEKEEEDS